MKLEPGSHPLRLAAGRRAVVVEVQNPEDAEHAMKLTTAFEGMCPLWIYQPAATADSASAFLDAGADHVARGLEEMEVLLKPASVSGPAVSAPVASDLMKRENSAKRRALIGSSRSMQALTSSISLVANRRCNVLIQGETGTGKEVVAREIHLAGRRSRGPWVPVNCGAIPDTLLEAELFGHVRGAFTGALQGRAGKFEAANHGTIFLDEIGDMPFAVQAKLLRVLQEKEVERLGGNERIRLDVRVIAATNVDLQDRVRQGLFRRDLFYRLNVFGISLPPLRQRPDDIPELAQHFSAKTCASEGLRPKDLAPQALTRLLEHDWPGNVRELENVIESAVIVSGTRPAISASDIHIAPVHAPRSAAGASAEISIPYGGLDYQQAIETFERNLLTQALARTRGNKTAAAELLRLKRTTLSARMRVLESRLPRLVA
ncbi:MAG TPA: sigma 54-interacting transcriptional regulator [Bryobacteraceae bacterium]|nr:sigma 54-interacting transcriptional regulator [Bryobacteraceae bacterium]